MTDKKLTDEEIIKALEDYIKENEFEYFHSNMMGEYPLIRKSLDLINRQKAEIERLQKENYLLSRNADTAFQDGLNECRQLFVHEIKAGAYKEFVERLKERKTQSIMDKRICTNEMIDNLLKEMAGEEE